MAEAIIRLDRSKPYSECRGERAPDDPHYKVHFFQGFRAGKNTIQLPFDANGILTPDDGKTEPYQGIAEGKSVMHQPLYTQEMRELVAKMRKRAGGHAAAPAAETEGDEEGGEASKSRSSSDDVNFESWLRGEARYQPFELRKAARERFSKNYPAGAFTQELVRDLVLDEKLVPEDQVCEDLLKFLPDKGA